MSDDNNNDVDNRQRDTKISDFVGTTDTNDADLLTVVQNGANKKITKADFVGGLGVTGTIVQDGAVTGTPVLDTQGTVNNIRNLEDGPGIKSNVSPENGITLEHNFQFDQEGAALSDDPAALSPIFRSITAGQGINVAGVGNEIQISASDIPVSQKTLTINSLDDFPDPIAGVITLEEDTQYFLVNDIDLGTNRIVFQNRSILTGAESLIITITYSGTGDMFTMSDTANRVNMLTISCPAGRVFNWSDTTGTALLVIADCSIPSPDRVGIFTGFRVGPSASIIRVSNTAVTAVQTSGIEFAGDYLSFLWEVSFFTILNGDCFKWGTTQFENFATTSSFFILIGPGTSFISGLPDSGNIITGGLAQISSCRVTGLGTPLTGGISRNDPRTEFFNNNFIADSRTIGAMGLSGNVVNTVLSTGVYVQVAGTQIASDLNSRAEVNVSDQLEFTNAREESGNAAISLNASRVGSGTNNYLFALFKNGVQVELTSGFPIDRNIEVGAIDASVSFIAPVTYVDGDVFDVRINRQGGSADLLIADMVLEID